MRSRDPGRASLPASRSRGWLGRSLALRDEPHPATRPDVRLRPRRSTRDGKPLPNARVAVLADRKKQVGDIDGRHRNILMGTAAADADGRFTLDVPRRSRHHAWIA